MSRKTIKVSSDNPKVEKKVKIKASKKSKAKNLKKTKTRSKKRTLKETKNTKSGKEVKNFGLKIKVVGVGGAGGNILTRLKKKRTSGLEYIAVNTDKQDLKSLPRSIKKIVIGKSVTKGLGAGMNPALGRASAETDKDLLADVIKGADILFLIAGFGGGTGTGATPVIAEIARQLGILTVVLLTKPFSFEGKERSLIAENGLKEVVNSADTVIAISNDQLFKNLPAGVSLIKGFELADSIFTNGILGIFESLIQPGLINLDFADLRAILEKGGPGILSVGIGEGDNRKEKALKSLMKGIPPEFSLSNSKKIFYLISHGPDISFDEIKEVIEKISQEVNPEAKVIFGLCVDNSLSSKIKVVLIATSFEGSNNFQFSSARISSFSLTKNEKQEFLDSKTKDKEKPVANQDKRNKEEEKESFYSSELDIPAFIRRRLHKQR